MTLEALNITAQANAAWEGRFLSSHVLDDVFVQFYDPGSLGVEVYYDPFKNKIIKLEPMKRQADQAWRLGVSIT